MELNLKRPLVVFDLESTGLNITEDRIIELSYVKVYPNGNKESKTYRFNPEKVIPQQAIDVHHITNEDLVNEPTFKERAHDIAHVFEGCDIAGFNSNHFDIPLLAQEMSKAGVNFDPSQHKFIDVQTIYHKREKRDLEAACLFYCGHPMENHHSAADDANTTLEVLMAQLDHYANDKEPLLNDVDFLSEYSTHNRNVDLAGRIIYNENKQPVFNFGKHKGKTVEDVFTKLDFGYYDWMMKSDFAENTKQVITKLYIQYKKK
ncbi:MAG: ribonuclease H-like domain-containing protein [Muribaculaceae bacterium]|nr:ribonuclease H-like domain-containing protein [Muribaculaceae bacterium]